MAKVIITKSLQKEINKKFKQSSVDIFSLMQSLEDSPKKGKLLATVDGIALKELKYGSFRFYFLTNGHMLKFGSADELASLLIKFIRMSEKKDQQKVINEIKEVLRSIGF